MNPAQLYGLTLADYALIEARLIREGRTLVVNLRNPFGEERPEDSVFEYMTALWKEWRATGALVNPTNDARYKLS